MLTFLLAVNQFMFYKGVLVNIWQIIIRFPPSKNVNDAAYLWFCYQHFLIYLKLSFLILFPNIFGRYINVSLFSWWVCCVCVCAYECMLGVGCKFKSFRKGARGLVVKGGVSIFLEGKL